MGLLAGDKIGGPSRMALELADSLLEKGRFDPEDVAARYKSWFDKEGFDTGEVAALVFRRMDVESNQNAVRDVHEQLNGRTAGCNPVHRCLSLALVPFLGPIDSPAPVISVHGDQEAFLTHRHPLAAEASCAYLAVIYQLVRSLPWDGEHGLFHRAALMRDPLIQEALLAPDQRPLSKGGFAPEVLRAGIYFFKAADSFQAALDSSCAFAGPDNYCPVLVGALAGTKWGGESIPPAHLSHCSPALVQRAMETADRLNRLFIDD